MQSPARLQTLSALLLVGFAWTCLDPASLRERAWSLLGADEPAQAEAPHREPTLIGHGEPSPSVEPPGRDPGSEPPRPQESVDGPAGPARPGDPALVPTIVRDDRPRLRSLREAARRMRLTAGQVESLLRLIEDAGRDLDDLRHVPNEAGETWHALAARIRVDGTAPVLVAARLEAFAHTTLRGGGETFEDVRQRILDRYADVMRSHLTVEQQQVWDLHDTTALVDPIGRRRGRSSVHDIELRRPLVRVAT